MNTINNENYVDNAERVIMELKEKRDRNGRLIQMVTTSKLRNILSMSAEIYNEVLLLEDETLGQEIKGRIDYLRIRILYEAGRDGKVKDLALGAKLINTIREIKTKSDYILFYRYMESLVAFHKFYGGKD